jgi:hypothetical protein
MKQWLARHKKASGVIGLALVGAVVLGACNNNSTPSAIQQNQRQSEASLNQLNQSQPIPQFKWSQIRQTLIDIETAQADSTQTTTFFFNQGVAAPVMTCPSVGYPVPSTDELTNPQQVVNDGYPNGGAAPTIPQIDPNGIYQGDSTGTYVLCVNGSGQTYGVYWEGFVYALSGPAVYQNGTVTPTGPSSFKFTTSNPNG